jgi:hypothetical protein
MTDALEDLATHTRQLVDASTGNAADGYDTNTRAAVLRLTNAVADEIGEETLAQWVVTRWLITRQPIRDCIAAATPPRPSTQD